MFCICKAFTVNCLVTERFLQGTWHIHLPYVPSRSLWSLLGSRRRRTAASAPWTARCGGRGHRRTGSFSEPFAIPTARRAAGALCKWWSPAACRAEGAELPGQYVESIWGREGERHLGTLSIPARAIPLQKWWKQWGSPPLLCLLWHSSSAAWFLVHTEWADAARTVGHLLALVPAPAVPLLAVLWRCRGWAALAASWAFGQRQLPWSILPLQASLSAPRGSVCVPTRSYPRG